MVRSPSIEDLYRIAVPEQPAISPDGTRVVYVLRSVDRGSDRDVRALWCVDRAGGVPRKWTSGPADSAPRWAPSGRSLCFLRGDGTGSGQLWRISSDGGQTEPITDLPRGAGPGAWSPDSRMIAFVAPTGDRNDEAAPVIIDRLNYQADGTGLDPSARQLYVADAASGEITALPVLARQLGDPAWSPDGLRLAVCAGLADDADLTGESRPYIIDMADPRRPPRPVGAPHGSVGAVLWSADGRALLAVGRTDTAAGHLGLLRIPADAAEPDVAEIINLAAPLDRNVMPGAIGYPGSSPQLCARGSQVLFCARDAGCTHLFAVPVSGGTPRPVVAGAGRVVSGLSVSADGMIAVSLATPESFGEIVTTALEGPEVVLTAHASLPGVKLIEPVGRDFTISDGTRVHGWLLRRSGAAGPQPLLLDVHGGPHNAWSGTADPSRLYQMALASLGWTVLLLNPRGSDGYGEQFFKAVCGAWGAADAQDFLEPVEQLVSDGLADPDRLSIAGYSYGGFVACHLTGRDVRFAAAVAGGPVTDLVSISGSADIGPEVARTEIGSPWWSAQQQFHKLSPLARIEKVRTPTLILQGTDDLRCPPGQAQQWFAGLRERRVPVQLVLYPGASHSFIIDGRPSHRADYQQRLLDWVRSHTAGRATPRSPDSGLADPDRMRSRLAELTERYRVPGAVLGVLRISPGGDDKVTLASCGVLNARTGAPVTDESLFQLGSVTKVWTATIAAQLADEGLLDLDEPVSDLLRELRLADPEAAKQLRVRHLLSHTSGLDGDIFVDTGRGDDCLERYVGGLDRAQQLFPPGAGWSYCNAGFVILGRIIEKLTGITWDNALQRRLVTPLGLTSTVTLPEDALLHSVAVGHVVDEEGRIAPAPFWSFPRSMGPAGLITSSAADVLRFAALHLRGGVAPDGARILRAIRAGAMQSRQASLPDIGSDRDSWGLGWARFDWGSCRAVGHDGGTIGQSAFLRLIPERGIAVTLLTNGDNGDGGRAGEFADSLFRQVFAELANVELPGPPVPPAEPRAVDVSHLVGTYERAGTRIEVLSDANGPVLRTVSTDPLVADLPGRVQEFALTPLTADRFVIRRPGAAAYTPAAFCQFDSGRRYVYLGGRATPKVD